MLGYKKSSGGIQGQQHSPSHGAVDPSLLTAERGIWAVKWSLLALLSTALFQLVIVLFSRSVALLADTIHNFADAATAVPLWVAYALSRRPANNRFTYGYGRVEDLAGLAIVLVIIFSTVVAAYGSIERLWHPTHMRYLGAVALAALVGFIGNEAIAIFLVKVGKQIGSAALVVDGTHARVDGLTSLAVLLGVVGAWLGYPYTDPVVGLLITAAIGRVAWQSSKSVFSRLLDRVDPGVVDEIRHAAEHIPMVDDITEIRVRWVGHRLHAEVNIAVDAGLSVEKGHEIALEVQHQLLHHLKFLSQATVHVDPATASGEMHHRIVAHTHDQVSAHGHD